MVWRVLDGYRFSLHFSPPLYQGTYSAVFVLHCFIVAPLCVQLSLRSLSGHLRLQKYRRSRSGVPFAMAFFGCFPWRSARQKARADADAQIDQIIMDAGGRVAAGLIVRLIWLNASRESKMKKCFVF